MSSCGKKSGIQDTFKRIDTNVRATVTSQSKRLPHWPRGRGQACPSVISQLLFIIWSRVVCDVSPYNCMAVNGENHVQMFGWILKMFVDGSGLTWDLCMYGYVACFGIGLSWCLCLSFLSSLVCEIVWFQRRFIVYLSQFWNLNNDVLLIFLKNGNNNFEI